MTVFKKSLMSSRTLLKSALYRERIQIDVNTLERGVWCAICGETIKDEPDMHEVMITKGMLSGHKDQDVINHRCNCVLRHHICPNGKQYHSPGVGSEEDYRNCIAQITVFMGKEAVLKWFDEIEPLFRVTVKHARQRYVTTLEEILKDNA